MTEQQFRVVGPIFTISEEIYQFVEGPDNKNMITVALGATIIKVHKDRLVSVDEPGRSVPFTSDGIPIAICPGCRTRLPVESRGDASIITCTCSRGVTQLVTTTVAQRLFTGIKQTDKEKPVTDATIPMLDLEFIKAFGVELWKRDKINFDHATVDVEAYVLLAENPDRKLCFQTYNGRLGKKDDAVKRLCLDQFRDNELIPDAKNADKQKSVGHALKDGLDKEREKLQKAGYSKV